MKVYQIITTSLIALLLIFASPDLFAQGRGQSKDKDIVKGKGKEQVDKMKEKFNKKDKQIRSEEDRNEGPRDIKDGKDKIPTTKGKKMDDDDIADHDHDQDGHAHGGKGKGKGKHKAKGEGHPGKGHAHGHDKNHDGEHPGKGHAHGHDKDHDHDADHKGKDKTIGADKGRGEKPVKSISDRAENKGKAHGRDKGDLSGKEFGMQRAEEARNKHKEKVVETKKEINKGEDVMSESRDKIVKAREKLEKLKNAGTISKDEISRKEAIIQRAEAKLKELEKDINQGKTQIDQ